MVRQWHRYSRGCRNDDPYLYPQGYIPVYPWVHVPRVLRVLMGKGNPAGTPINYIIYLFTKDILINPENKHSLLVFRVEGHGGDQRKVPTPKMSEALISGLGIEGWWRLERSGNPENERLCSFQGWVVVAGGCWVVAAGGY